MGEYIFDSLKCKSFQGPKVGSQPQPILARFTHPTPLRYVGKISERISAPPPPDQILDPLMHVAESVEAMTRTCFVKATCNCPKRKAAKDSWLYSGDVLPRFFLFYVTWLGTLGSWLPEDGHLRLVILQCSGSERRVLLCWTDVNIVKGNTRVVFVYVTTQ